MPEDEALPERPTSEEETLPQTEDNEVSEEEEQGEDPITRANRAADRLEAANKEQKLLLQQQQKLYVNQKLGGRSEAGTTAPQPKIETPKEYAQRITRGDLRDGEW